jgi:hypothetical protein
VLREAGLRDTANDVLYFGKERERANAAGWRRAWLGLQRATIGYGLGWRYSWSLAWAVLLLYFGAVVFSPGAVEGAQAPPIWDCFGYSLERLLPLVQLGTRHFGDVELHAWQRWYFYLHQLSGFALASMVVAGLTGVTKR